MQTLKSIFVVALLSVTGFAQTIEVKTFEATLAKSVQVEQLADSVAVILTENLGTKTGAYLQVASPAKWATPLLDGVTITQTQQPGQWILFAAKGKYRILLAEFDPETGPRYTYHDLVIGNGTNPDPIVIPPPVAGFEALKKVAKEKADALNDPQSRNALIAAYRSTKGTTYDELVADAKLKRRAAMQLRQGDSLSKDWSSWLTAVDAELVKAVNVGDADGYKAALIAIIEGLGG